MHSAATAATRKHINEMCEKKEALESIYLASLPNGTDFVLPFSFSSLSLSLLASEAHHIRFRKSQREI